MKELEATIKAKEAEITQLKQGETDKKTKNEEALTKAETASSDLKAQIEAMKQHFKIE